LCIKAVEMKFKVNIGIIDRVLRFVIGVAIVSAGIAYSSWWGLLGVVPLATGSTGFCGLYSVFGINTCRGNDKCVVPEAEGAGAE